MTATEVEKRMIAWNKEATRRLHKRLNEIFEPVFDFIINQLRAELIKGEIMEQKPSIGRTVHYQRYGSPGGEHKAEPSPAVITQVHADGTTCQLFVMNPNGLYFNTTPYSEEPKPGHWNWPPKV